MKGGFLFYAFIIIKKWKNKTMKINNIFYFRKNMTSFFIKMSAILYKKLIMRYNLFTVNDNGGINIE